MINYFSVSVIFVDFVYSLLWYFCNFGNLFVVVGFFFLLFCALVYHSNVCFNFGVLYMLYCFIYMFEATETEHFCNFSNVNIYYVFAHCVAFVQCSKWVKLIDDNVLWNVVCFCQNCTLIIKVWLNVLNIYYKLHLLQSVSVFARVFVYLLTVSMRSFAFSCYQLFVLHTHTYTHCFIIPLKQEPAYWKLIIFIYFVNE
jgi:hypothetical protein